MCILRARYRIGYDDTNIEYFNMRKLSLSRVKENVKMVFFYANLFLELFLDSLSYDGLNIIEYYWMKILNNE